MCASKVGVFHGRIYEESSGKGGSFAVNWTRSDDVAVRIVGHEITPISSRVVVVVVVV